MHNLNRRTDPMIELHPAVSELPPIVTPKTIVLVGLMGAGKSAVGRRLAAELELPFIDADTEIAAAAGCTIPEIFERHGEPAFRDGERRVIARLLKNEVCVLSTGGGAFMDARTRRLTAQRAISIWLRAKLETLMARTARRTDRPLLNNADPRGTMRRLMDERYPIYAKADITVDSAGGTLDDTVRRVLTELRRHLGQTEPKA